MKNSLLAGLAVVLAACASPAPRSNPPAPAGRLMAPDSAPTGADSRMMFVDAALGMLGQPYRWGGAAPGGFDCSGLVVYAGSDAGVRLPRTAHEQLRAGLPVSRQAVRAGDLVFMHLAHKELHVGIAVDGNRFVHAPSAGGQVRIDSLAVAPYARGFVAARRVIGPAAGGGGAPTSRASP